MVRLGYQAVNVGERDLARGYDALLERTSGLPLTLVSSNIVRQDTREPAFKPYVLVNVKAGKGKKDVKVGILGALRLNPIFQKPGPAGTNLVIAPPLEALKKYVPEVRKQADVVVVLAALHKDDARAIARAVPGVDFILGGFASMVSAQDELEGTTQIRYVGNQGKYLSESRVMLGPGGGILSVGNYMHLLTARYLDDGPTLQWLAEKLRKVHEIERAAAGTAAAAPGAR
jgi:2',3'-cyclic-nucleotide 2'-phosphodiesterase (5'-nucleotidase family)